MSKPHANNPTISGSGYVTSWPRVLIALLLVVGGIVWMALYINLAKDAALFDPKMGGTKPHTPLPFMSAMGRWNYLVGFGLICAGLTAAAHKATPLGRGTGVVVGMLFCFLFGLVWIVVFYFLGDNISKVPVMKDLDQYNLVVGIAFMAVGFTYATKWE